MGEELGVLPWSGRAGSVGLRRRYGLVGEGRGVHQGRGKAAMRERGTRGAEMRRWNTHSHTHTRGGGGGRRLEQRTRQRYYTILPLGYMYRELGPLVLVLFIAKNI